MLKKFWNDEDGQGMTEYVLIIALIAVAVIVIVNQFGGQIKNLFTASKNKIASETSGLGSR